MIWAYAPNRTTRRNVGQQCLYCNRVWCARFKGKYRSVEKLVEVPGRFFSWQQSPQEDTA